MSYYSTLFRLAPDDARQIVAATAALHPADLAARRRWENREMRELYKALGLHESAQRIGSCLARRSARRSNIARLMRGHDAYANPQTARTLYVRECRARGVESRPGVPPSESGRRGGLRGAATRWGDFAARRAEARRLREEGKTLAEIAGALGISVSGVSYAVRSKE